MKTYCIAQGAVHSALWWPKWEGNPEKRGCMYTWPSQVALEVKNPFANAGDIRDAGLIPGLGRSPRRGHGNPLQYPCLENPWIEEPGGLQSMGLQSWMQLSDFALLHMYTCSWCTLLYSRNESNIVKQSCMCMCYIPIKTNFKKAMWWSKVRVQEYFVVHSGHVPEKLYTSIYQANPISHGFTL